MKCGGEIQKRTTGIAIMRKAFSKCRRMFDMSYARDVSGILNAPSHVNKRYLGTQTTCFTILDINNLTFLFVWSGPGSSLCSFSS